ncbi:MAG: hypothetical protein HY864_14530 [Chloroflexi bacterium]|nr:hypothetical protein [Chloroflexota bacterium]
MIRRFNYTKRKNISRKEFKIALNLNDGNLSFDADLSRLDSYDLPKGSLVFVEAYRQTNWIRFDFGQIGDIRPAEIRDLSLFDTHEGLLFRVKVTEAGEGKLLAEADRIPFVLPDDKEIPLEPLLKIRPQNLGKEIYRIDYSDDRNGPILLINSLSGNYERIGRNPAFISLVYPSVFREILRRIFYIEKYFEYTDRNDWRSRWLLFARSFPGAGEMPNKDESDQFDDWTDKVIEKFCKKIQVFERFSEFWSSEG